MSWYYKCTTNITVGYTYLRYKGGYQHHKLGVLYLDFDDSDFPWEQTLVIQGDQFSQPTVVTPSIPTHTITKESIPKEVCLIIWVNLFTQNQLVNGTFSQKSNLYRGHCRINNAINILIIDRGSQEDLIFSDLIEQSRLLTEPLNHKFNLNRLSSLGSNVATKLCRVNFSIQVQYTDTITFSGSTDDSLSPHFG